MSAATRSQLPDCSACATTAFWRMQAVIADNQGNQGNILSEVWNVSCAWGLTTPSLVR